MFERRILKQRAKDVLSKNYWNIFMVIILVNLVNSVISGIVLFPAEYSPIISFPLSFAASILVIMPLQVGLIKYVLNLSDSESKLDNLLYSFRSNYMNIATVLLLKELIIAAFVIIPAVIMVIGVVVFAFFQSTRTLLILPLVYIAFIPVIIKSYDYYLVEYILTEKPDLSWREALKESKTLMHGNRFATFKLHLSFLGWLLLGVLALGIGTIFVMPYMQATDAELYKEISGKTKTYSDFEAL